MSLHDAYARLTPYELLFEDEQAAADLAAAVEEESAGRGADPEVLHAFLTMGAVTDFVRRVDGDEASADAIHRYGPLAYHALHFHRAGRPLYLLGTHAARYLVGGPGGTDARPPHSSGYLQLPQHLFWLDDGSGTPQSLDGLFWTTTAGGRLHGLLVSGVRPDRSGLAIVLLPDAPLEEADSWLELDARGDGSDFANPMPGAELDLLYLISTSGEAFKLMARFFAYAAAAPEALVAVDSAPTGAEDGAAVREDADGPGGGPEPSRLAHTRVTLER